MGESDTAFLDRLRARAAKQDISRFFGIELEEVAPGRSRASMVCREEMANILGMVHGTALFALIDESFQAAVNAHGTEAVALSMSVAFHRAPKVGERLTANADETSGGARIATYQIAITDSSGGLVASCQALAYRKGVPSSI